MMTCGFCEIVCFSQKANQPRCGCDTKQRGWYRVGSCKRLTVVFWCHVFIWRCIARKRKTPQTHNAASSSCLHQQWSVVKVISQTLSLPSLATFWNDVVLYSLNEREEMKGNRKQGADHFLLLFLCVLQCGSQMHFVTAAFLVCMQ